MRAATTKDYILSWIGSLVESVGMLEDRIVELERKMREIENGSARNREISRKTD